VARPVSACRPQSLVTMFTRRTVLAFAVAGVLARVLAFVGLALDFGPWAMAIAVTVIGLLATLFDRDGFYGPREHR
jgi:uncharacterized membrane protein YjjB (DUF3815 family)